MAASLLFATTLLLAVLENSPTYAVWETDAAINPWMRSYSARDMETALISTFTPGPQGFTWRGNGSTIQAEDERLIRWDSRLPREIFRHGFIPWVTSWNVNDLALDLRSYVTTNSRSIFVGTARRRRSDGIFWHPRRRNNVFRYDIYAPGGIDVNPTLGDHPFQTQNEIAFVGGIRREYIYGAMEFVNRRAYRYHRNAYFSRGLPRPPRICATLVTIYYAILNMEETECYEDVCNAPSKRQADANPMRSEGSIEDYNSFCVGWFIIRVTALTFTQTSGENEIEPYGYIRMHMKSYNNPVLNVFDEGDDSYPTVQSGARWPVEEKTKIFESVSGPQDNPEVCVRAAVYEFDPTALNRDDQLTNDPHSLCKVSFLTSSNNMTLSGPDGSVIVTYDVSPCDDSCWEEETETF